MKFKVNKKEISKVVKEVARAVDSRISIDILKNILISIDDDSKQVIMVGKNAMFSIKSSLNTAEVMSPGKIAVRGDMFMSTLDSSRGEKITFETKEESGRAVVKTDAGGSYRIPIMNADMFPEVAKLESEKATISIGSSELATAISQAVSTSDSKSETRYAHGINMKSVGCDLVFTGTDARTGFSRAIIKQKEPLLPFDVFVPRESLGAVVSLLSSVDIPVTITIYDRFIIFKSSDMMISSQLYDLKYPNVESRILRDEQVNSEFEVDKDDFIASLKGIINIASKDSHIGSKVTITVKQDGNMVLGIETDSASAEEVVGVSIKKTDKDFSIEIDGAYLVRCLSSFDSGKILVKYGCVSSAGVIKMTPSTSDLVMATVIGTNKN